MYMLNSIDWWIVFVTDSSLFFGSSCFCEIGFWTAVKSLEKEIFWFPNGIGEHLNHSKFLFVGFLRIFDDWKLSEEKLEGSRECVRGQGQYVYLFSFESQWLLHLKFDGKTPLNLKFRTNRFRGKKNFRT